MSSGTIDCASNDVITTTDVKTYISTTTTGPDNSNIAASTPV